MIYYDVTDLVRHALHSSKVTGIQRVLLEGMRGLGSAGVPIFVSPATGKWYLLNDFNAVQMQDLSAFRHLWERADLVAYPTRRNVGVYLKRRLGHGRDAFIGRLHRGLVRLPFARRKLNRFTARFTDPGVFHGEGWPNIRPLPILGPGDKLVLFGTPWNALAAYEELLASMPAEVEKVFLVYDLIPLNSPYVPDELRESFRIFIPFVLRHATSVVVNSDSARHDLSVFAAAHHQPLPLIRKINLAHQFPPAPPHHAVSSLRVRKLFAEKYVLCVGSIESRKNHLNLLAVWSKFVRSADYQGEKLVIAGAWLWDFQAIQNMLAETGHVWGSVIVIEHPDDHELRALYAHCRFTAYPSHYEGWGLPVGESLSHGKPCLHFDNSSLREAGCGLSDIVPYHNLGWYYDSMRRLLIDDRYYQQRRDNIARHADRLRSWTDFSNEVGAALRQPPRAGSLR